MSDTPETDALGYIPTDLAPAWPIVEHARRLERQRGAYAETLRVIASTNERSHHEAAFATLILKRHPELGNETCGGSAVSDSESN